MLIRLCTRILSGVQQDATLKTMGITDGGSSVKLASDGMCSKCTREIIGPSVHAMAKKVRVRVSACERRSRYFTLALTRRIAIMCSSIPHASRAVSASRQSRLDLALLV